MRNGFTLLELLIVVIVIAVLATIAAPQYLKAVERAKVAKAKSNLETIAKAEKMYRSANSAYTETWTDLDDWAEGVGSIDTNDTDWDYTITAGADTFTIQAARAGAGGAYGGQTITIDEKSSLGGSHPMATTY